MTALPLASERWTTAERLTAHGGSAGGILVSRAITERPELFHAAVILAGIVNPVRYLEGANGANQTSELQATPSTEDGLRTLLAMDAYQDIRPRVAYPPVLFEIGLNDGLVPTWHSAKLAARLQANGRPALIRVAGDTGHAYGTTVDQRAAAKSDVMAFALWHAGDPAFQP